MPEYLNPHAYDLLLADEAGKKVRIARGRTIVLSEYFNRYLGKQLQSVGAGKPPAQQAPKSKQKKSVQSSAPAPAHRPVPRSSKHTTINNAKMRIRRRDVSQTQTSEPNKQRLVGKKVVVGATEEFAYHLQHHNYPISNNVGVGILSYNRAPSLQRLIKSITKYTNLYSTTVFVSDDGSTDVETKYYLNWLESQGNVVVLQNDKRLGVAGNANRLLKCLERFRYKLLINDDVEVLASGWDTFYFDAMRRSGLHHACYREPGVYGAKLGRPQTLNGVDVLVVDEKPHGAIMALDHDAFKLVGYFDESFGYYGMEHVDWSDRVSKSSLQPDGYFDVVGSNKYFRLHADQSACPDRIDTFKAAKKRYESIKPSRKLYIQCSSNVAVPSISCVIPFRDTSRHGAILAVLNNIRAQRFPRIDIVMSEHDVGPRFSRDELCPAEYVTSKTFRDNQFNKSVAFNAGVSKCLSDSVVLHDADTLASGDYFSKLYGTLGSYESCHFGERIFYADAKSTDDIITTGLVGDVVCDSVVSYFEGGSIGCRVPTYWAVGGFVEDFVGYGCFAPGNYVLCETGYKPIESVTAIDKLLTHTGAWYSPVCRSRPYNGKILDVFVPGRLPIKGITPEHPLLVNRGDYGQWIKAVDLRVGDIIVSTDTMPELVDESALRRIGAAHSFGRRKGGSFPGSSEYTFDLTVNREFQHLVGCYYPKPQVIGSSSMGKSRFGTVFKLEEREYSGLVYNFEVPEDHSYIVNGLVAHNCEDCDFYERLSTKSLWKNNRSLSFLHLQHGRTDGWREAHERNKKLEAKLKKLSMQERITMQHKMLRKKYPHIAKWLT